MERHFKLASFRQSGRALKLASFRHLGYDTSAGGPLRPGRSPKLASFRDRAYVYVAAGAARRQNWLRSSKTAEVVFGPLPNRWLLTISAPRLWSRTMSGNSQFTEFKYLFLSVSTT